MFCNGFQYNITGAILDNLKREFHSSNVNITLIQTPLSKFDSREIRIEKFSDTTTKKYRFPIFFAPPMSYLLDLLIGLLAIRSTVFVSFSPHVGYVALLMGKFNTALRLIHWSIDFSPQRFKNALLQRIYDFVDCRMFLKSHIHVDVSEPALKARVIRYVKLEGNESALNRNRLVVRVGIPDDSVSLINLDNFYSKRVFFLGNLNPTVGIDTFVYVAKEIAVRIPRASFHVIGNGSEFESAVLLSKLLGIDERFSWYGNLEKGEFENLLKTASVGLAPYKSEMGSFSQFADPSKLKNYMQFAIPFVVTDVPLVVQELRVRNVGIVTANSVQSIAHETIGLLQDRNLWSSQRTEIHEYAKTQTWNTQLLQFKAIVCNFLFPE